MMKTGFTSLLCLLVALLLGTAPLLAQGGGEAELADQYYADGEYQNALELYEKLHKKEPQQERFAIRAVDCHRSLGQLAEGISFLDKARRQAPANWKYAILHAELYKLGGDAKKAEETHRQVITKMLLSERDFAECGTFYYVRGSTQLSLDTYTQARKALKQESLFAEETAHLHAILGQPALATREYLNHYFAMSLLGDPTVLESVKLNILNLVTPDTETAIETELLAQVQSHPDNYGVRQIVYEYYVLIGNFYEAFVQVKGVDKAFKQTGEEVYKFAMTMRSNRNYKLSNTALDYIIDNHPRSSYYFQSHQEKTVNSEMIAFEKVPLDTHDIRAAVQAYDHLLEEFGRKPSFFKAIYRKANLLAFYLNDLPGALSELDALTKLPLTQEEKAQASLLQGDIYLMQKRYFDAERLYDQVVELFKEGQIGAMGKYRQGRLYYFKGDFEFAQNRLKSIKDNTSNDISNDAIRLFLLIQDGSGLDSVTTALQMFSQAQLLIYQREFDSAQVVLDSLLYLFPTHGLADEVYWEKANMALGRNDMDKTLLFLDKIIRDHPEDILADDALFTKARIFDYTLKDKDAAMKLYIDFLRDYPGSLFIVEVRKRIRELRNG